MGEAASPIPTLSQARNWDADHLETAATHWTARATAWDDAYTAVYRQVPTPGGEPWEGQTAESALLRVGTDRLRVLAAADLLHDLSAVARRGATDIRAAKQLVLRSVDAAQAAGFDVSEDLSLFDRVNGGPPAFRAARKAQAQGHAAKIRLAAMGLVATDSGVASEISTAAAGLTGTQFPTDTMPGFGQTTMMGVRRVDFPQDGGPSQPNVPGQPQSSDFVSQYQQFLTAPPLAPPPEPPPPPPVTGDPIKLPPPSGPPPVTVIDANLPGPPPEPGLFPNCSGSRVFWDFVKVGVGGLGIAGGAVAEPFTFGAGTVPIIAGTATLAEGEYDLSQCK